MDDYLSLYLQYTEQTESPTFFHRWSGLVALSAYLGRTVYLKHGHFTVYPNTYCVLMGAAGTKKSTAIKISVKLLKLAGFDKVAPKKISKERFLQELSDQHNPLDEPLFNFESSESDQIAEIFVAADEFNNFIGIGNFEFMSLLGELWDYTGIFQFALRTKKDIFIHNPNVTILGGNTPVAFSQAFPPEVIGQGFFSRIIFVYAPPSGVKITIPPAPDESIERKLIHILHKIKKTISGEVRFDTKAYSLLDSIYHTWKEINDPRFAAYSNRRLTHLIKLCIVIAVSKLSSIIKQEHVVEANTILTFTEHFMPKALGEFGKAKNADIAHRIIERLDNATEPIPLQTLFKYVHHDVDNFRAFTDIVSNLRRGEKIQQIEVNEYVRALLPIRAVKLLDAHKAVNWNFLTENELNTL